MASNLEFIGKFEVTGTVQTLDCDNVFSDAYKSYFIKVSLKESSSGNDQWIRIRLIDNSGSVISDSEYDYAQYVMPSNTGFYDTNRAENQDNITYSGIGYVDGPGQGGEMYIHNPADSASYTFMTASSSTTVTGHQYTVKGIAFHEVAETIRGIRFYSTAYFGSGSVSIYGVK